METCAWNLSIALTDKQLVVINYFTELMGQLKLVQIGSY